MVQPAVYFFHPVIHAADPIVVQPSSYIFFDIVQGGLNALSFPSGRKVFQSRLELPPRLRMNFDVDATTVPSQCEAEKFKILDCKHADCSAFLSIDRQFQCPFKISGCALQEPFRGSLALC